MVCADGGRQRILGTPEDTPSTQCLRDGMSGKVWEEGTPEQSHSPAFTPLSPSSAAHRDSGSFTQVFNIGIWSDGASF